MTPRQWLETAVQPDLAEEPFLFKGKIHYSGMRYVLENCMPEPNSGCWLWTGTYGAAGYGILTRRKLWGGRSRLAHRYSYEMTYGDPGKLGVLHKCDNPACVNPAHLFSGDQRANMMDCSRKGRTGPRPMKGENTGSAKLTENDVRFIREKVRKWGTANNCSQLAARFGVSSSTVARIVRGETWVHVK